MSELIIIGGSPRAGKTTTVKEILRQKPMPYISTDALRFGLRNALFGEPYVSVDKLSFSGDAEFRRPGTKGSHLTHFSQTISEDEMAWKAAVGIIDHYDRIDENLLIEGMVFTPEQVHALKLGNLTIRAAFVGYSKEAHIETILREAQSDPSDWINKWLEETDGNDAEIRKWVASEVEKSRANAELAKQYGYGYFDVTTRPFAEHIQAIQDYLLREQA